MEIENEELEEGEIASAEGSRQEAGEGPTFEERVEIFKQMLREKNVAPFSSWEKELPKFAFDPRFKILPDHGDRRAVFDQFSKNRVAEQRQEKKEKLTAGREVCKKMVEAGNITHTTTFERFKEQLKGNEAFKLLASKDREKLYNETVAPLKKQHEEKENALKQKAKENFIQLLQETKEIDAKSIWAKVRRDLDDPRNDDPKLTAEDKEKLFNEYVLSLDEGERRRRREEAALKERERDMQRMREKELRERDRAQQRQKEQSVVTDFQIFLREKIRDPDASWTKSRKKLEEDPRWNIDLPLETKERLFREHIKSLQENQVMEFRSLLDYHAKVGTINLSTSSDFEAIKQKLRDDPRYDKVSATERRTVFEQFLRDVKRSAIDEFKELLQENKNMGHISSKSETSGPKFEKLKTLFKTDKRYARLDPIPEERDRVMIKFIESVLERSKGKGKE